MVRDSVKTGVQGIFNTMYHLGMLDGTPVLPSEPPIRLRTEVQYRANSGGITYWDVEPGDRISKGEIIGRTVSVFGDVTEIIRAPEDGLCPPPTLARELQELVFLIPTNNQPRSVLCFSNKSCPLQGAYATEKNQLDRRN